MHDDYNTLAKKILEELKPTFEQIKLLGQDIKTYPNKLDKEFYLKIQDELSECYDKILEKYIGELEPLLDIAEANILLALKEKYESENKKLPNSKILEAEVIREIKDVLTINHVLESWVKITKNYIQTVRSHINAITGREIEEEK